MKLGLTQCVLRVGPRFMTRRNFLLNGAGVRSLRSMIPEVNTELPEGIVLTVKA